MAEPAGASVPTTVNGEVFTILPLTLTVDGGEGFDTLVAGGFQMSFRSVWNLANRSGGEFGMLDPASGRAWTLGFTNIESVVGSPYADRLMGNTQITSLFGGGGDDIVTAAMDSPNSSYLRGGEGSDSLSGGLTFDDINGNQGNDTAHGWEAGDWVVGGQGDDLLSGDQGGDIVYGNLGADTCDGGDGDDQVRGGQGDDSVAGGAGSDFLSGDRGSDTVSGGAGADTFHGSQDAGLDLVLDFSLADGDRVQLDPGVAYAVVQRGADTVIDMGGGNQMVLVGVLMADLSPGWLIVA